MTHKNITILALTILVGACEGGPQAGGQVGEEVDPGICVVVSQEAISSSQTTDEDYLVADAVDYFSTTLSDTIKWADGTETLSTWTFGIDSSDLEYHRREAVQDEGASVQNTAPCDHLLSMKVTLSADSEDGR